MRFRHVPLKTIWVLHHATKQRLAPAIVEVIDVELAAHLYASRTQDGTRSVVVIGVDQTGNTKTYRELPLTDEDEAACWAWRSLDLDEMASPAREKLPEGKADQVPKGMDPAEDG